MLHGTTVQQNNQRNYEALKTDVIVRPDPINSTLSNGPYTGCYKIRIAGGVMYELDKNTNLQGAPCVDENGANNFVPGKVILAISGNLVALTPAAVYIDTPDAENVYIHLAAGIERRIQVTRVRLTGTLATEIQLWY